MATLEKAKLMNVDKGTTQEVLFNPKEYSVQKSVQWEPHKAPGLDTPEQEFTSGNPAVLSVELFFDTFEDNSSVKEHTDQVMALALVDADSHRPPLVQFQWGDFQFKGVIESLALRYTMFLSTGKPCQRGHCVSGLPATGKQKQGVAVLPGLDPENPPTGQPGQQIAAREPRLAQ